MKSHARVVVIGGGMMGVGLLYHLAREGWKDCVLIEKGELTSGSTWHAAGQCPSFIADYNMAKIHHYGNKLYATLEAETGQYVGWHGCGGIRLATTPEEVDWFHWVQGFSTNVGFRMEIIGPNRIKAINPFLNTDGILAGAWTQDDGHVDPAGCCNALAKAARDLGAEIVRRNRVLDIKRRPSGEWEVFTEQGNIVSEHVVNAAGCYAREVGRMVGLEVPITNMQHQYLVTESILAFVERDQELPVMRDPYTAGYYRQEQKSGLIGVFETGSAEAWGDDGGHPAWEAESELFVEDLDRIALWVERVFERMPILADAGITKIVNGGIPHSPDGNPLLGPAGGLRNFWLCCGSSIGIAQGAGCGHYLGQWMVHGDSEINMAGLDPRRFGAYANEDYTRAKSFQDYEEMFVTHLPGEERPAGRPARKSPLHEKLAAKGCVHTEGFGWERPKWFSHDGREEKLGFRRNNVFEVVAEECRAVRERVGVQELSSFAKFDVTGEGAEVLLDRVFANRMPRKVGGMVLAHLLSDIGRIQSEATVTRLAVDRFYVLSGAAWEVRDFDTLKNALGDGGDGVSVANVTDDYGTLVVAGPRSRDTLSKITDTDLSNQGFRWLTGHEIEIAGVPVRALRVNYVGELGWELHCPMSAMETLYDAVWRAGEAFGIADFGLYAMNALRMEKAYRGIGAELTNEITLIEADMERFLNLDKGDFAGRRATEKVKAGEIVLKLVYGELDAVDSDVRGGEPVFDGEATIGVTTSGGYGHAVKKSLFFAYVTPAYAKPDTAFEIKVLGDRRPARVLAEPAYDPKNERLRA
ncbi:MAG: FAD-dependent oxidoreductase [Kiloniellales bacterium]